MQEYKVWFSYLGKVRFVAFPVTAVRKNLVDHADFSMGGEYERRDYQRNSD